MRLKYENDTESHDITLNLEDVYLDNNKVFLDPYIKNNGLLKVLKKKKIIKEINGCINYNYTNVPIAILNMGILKKYDFDGVRKYLDRINR